MKFHGSLLLLAVGAAALAAGTPAAAQNVSLAGVHWYSGDTGMLDMNLPAGTRGWNVEAIYNVLSCDGNPATDPGVRARAQVAKNHGLVNIIRVDYQNLVAVPPNSGQYQTWATHFIHCTQELSDLSNLFIVGNEPNIEGNQTPQQYANAFNYLYARKNQMPPGTQLLAVDLSPWAGLSWINQMSRLLSGADGFAFHTGGARPNCQDPRQPCNWGGWPFDGGFRYYRNIIDNIDSRWWTRPVYITEFNTYTGDQGSQPRFNYPANWINKAFEEVRNYNATRGNKPPVRALAWFVDRDDGGWGDWALRNLGGPRADMTTEFRNPANVNPGGGGCIATVPSGSWRGQYFPNVSLSGSPTLVRNDGSAALNFNWGTGGPNTCGIGSDNFSVRWTRTVQFAAGTHRFTVTSDDGFRLYVGGVLRLDRWIDQAPTTYTVDVAMTAGNHEVRLDWYERTGGATAQLSWAAVGGGDNAQILPAESSVPSSMAPNETRAVRVRVRNTGGTTWPAGGLVRLGTQPDNGVTWSGWNCGGYMNSISDGRVYLCSSVAPNASYDFHFNVRAPASGTPRLSVRMVRDGVAWFGSGHSWPITVSGGNPYPNCPCTAGFDNYCNHAPRTPGCPMTQAGGYCDPNGDGSYSDADWVRGWNEFQQYCR